MEILEGCPHYYIGVQVDIIFRRVVHNTKISIGIGGVKPRENLIYQKRAKS